MLKKTNTQKGKQYGQPYGCAQTLSIANKLYIENKYNLRYGPPYGWTRRGQLVFNLGVSVGLLGAQRWFVFALLLKEVPVAKRNTMTKNTHTHKSMEPKDVDDCHHSSDSQLYVVHQLHLHWWRGLSSWNLKNKTFFDKKVEPRFACLSGFGLTTTSTLATTTPRPTLGDHQVKPKYSGYSLLSW